MTRKKREQYEALIESIMIGEIAATRNNPELNNILQSKVSVEKKRMAITSVLDENVKVFNKIRRFVENNNVSRSEFVRYLVEQLKYYVKDGEIEQKKYGEVMTPFSLVNDMLDTLPKEVWNNPDLKWFDPANGVGIFPVIIVERLMKGLEEIIPDEDERYRHIMEEMIYVSELQPRNAFLFLVGFDPLNEFDLNIYLGDSLGGGLTERMEEWGIGKFDVIVGNPPYQKMDGGGTGSSAMPLYNIFIEKMLPITDKLLFVTPSRWFSGGKGLDSFRHNMLTCKKIKKIKHFSDSKKIFGNSIDIAGGVSYFLIDNNYNGLTKIENEFIDISKIDVLLYNKTQYNILYKIQTKSNSYFNENVFSRKPFGLSSNYNNWKIKGVPTITRTGIKIADSKDIIDNFEILNKYKLLISKADGNAHKTKRYISKYQIVKPNIASIETYLVCFVANDEKTIKIVGEYLMTKFSRFLLSLRLNSQNNSKDKFRFIPNVDFSKNWTDEMLYKYFNLTQDEIELIEKSVN